MKIITRAVYQMTPAGFDLLEEESHEYEGPIAEAKNAQSILAPGTQGNETGAGFFEGGGTANHILDPLDLFGGDETAAAKQAQKDLPGQLTDLNNLQANVSRYDTNGPFGTSKWSIDPKTGRYTQTTNLNPSEQNQFDTRNQIAEQMMNKAQSWAPQSSSSFDYNSEVPALADKQYAKTSSLTSPVMGEQDQAWKAKMANAGLSPTSDAFKEVQAQRGADTNFSQGQAKAQATTAAIPLAQQQRQQRMTEIAQLMGGQQLNSPALGGNGVDVAGATNAANQVGINNANQSAAARNANMQSLAGLMQLAYPNGFGG